MLCNTMTAMSVSRVADFTCSFYLLALNGLYRLLYSEASLIN